MYREIQYLLESSKKGDGKAKEALLSKLHPLIISSIRRYYNRKEEYDDLIQEGYETILSAIDYYDPARGVHFLGYVKARLKYLYLEKHKQKQVLSLNEPVKGGEFIDLLEGDGWDPIDLIIYKEEIQALQEGINSLPQRQREVIILYYIKGLSMEQIAKKLGISYRTVANTKTIAINKLKKIMVK